MNYFWTHVRAEFLVELVSKTLFSGKHPRFVAFLVVLGMVLAYAAYLLGLLAFSILRIPFMTRRARLRRTYRRSVRAAKRFRDTPSELVIENEYAGFSIRTPGVILFFEIHLPTELLSMYHSTIDGPPVRIGYEGIRPFVPGNTEFSMRMEFADYLYQVIRTNVL